MKKFTQENSKKLKKTQKTGKKSEKMLKKRV
jgi:hypothetical protein